MNMRKGGKRRLAVWSVAATLILLPLLAIRGVGRDTWDVPGDFVFLSILLAGVGIGYELAARVTDRNAYLAGAGVAVAAALLSVWINLAVGIIGSEDNPANLLYAAVLAVGAIGALLARFRPLGMVYAMAATTAAQIFVFVIALVAGLGFTGPITVFFAALWSISAWLFRKAAREPASVAAARGHPRLRT